MCLLGLRWLGRRMNIGAGRLSEQQNPTEGGDHFPQHCRQLVIPIYIGRLDALNRS